jgi:hypothetical protein
MSDFDLYLGYEIESENPQELAANAAPWDEVLSTADAPPEIDYGHGFSIRNQGNRGSCRGHSIAACARMGARLAAGAAIDLDGNGTAGDPIKDDFSPLWAWVRSQQHGGTVGANRGATMSGGIKLGLQDGFAREVVWPYSNPHGTRFPAEVIADATRFKFGRYSTLESEQQVHDWLASGQGPCEWGKGWPFSWVGGCLVDSGYAGRGGHATAIRGYWTGERVAREVPSIAAKVKAEPYVYVCENSHSERAQWKGLYFVTRRGMAAVLNNRSTHLLGWSDLTYPLVRKANWATVNFV